MLDLPIILIFVPYWGILCNTILSSQVVVNYLAKLGDLFILICMNWVIFCSVITIRFITMTFFVAMFIPIFDWKNPSPTSQNSSHCWWWQQIVSCCLKLLGTNFLPSQCPSYLTKPKTQRLLVVAHSTPLSIYIYPRVYIWLFIFIYFHHNIL